MSKNTRSTPAWLLALGPENLPETIILAGRSYRMVRPFKHDFFAATALYESGDEKVVLKIGRTSRLLGLSTRWIGEVMSRHEFRLLELAQGLGGIPRLVGRWQATGLVHEYIEGRPLNKGDRPPDNFFPRLSELLGRLHERSIAYVDLEKPENVLLGDDGRPYLFDFQISWHLRAQRFGGSEVARLVLDVLQQSDCYHLLKHWRKLRPDQLDPSRLASATRIPFWIKWHRAVFRPMTLARRQVLVWMGLRSSVKVRSPG
jgi:hypothetical protein